MSAVQYFQLNSCAFILHFSDTLLLKMSKLLKFPIRLQNHAFKCLAVANASKTKVEVEKCENCSKISLIVSPGIEIYGSGAICKYLMDLASPDLIAQSKTLQWISFVDSEIR